MFDATQTALFGELETLFERYRHAFSDLDREYEAHITHWKYAVNAAFELQAPDSKSSISANDYEAMDDIHDEIRACVPDEKLRLLEARGLLD